MAKKYIVCNTCNIYPSRSLLLKYGLSRVIGGLKCQV